MASLYEINTAILGCVDMETGEILDVEAFHNLNMEKAEAIEQLALWVKNLEADITAYKAERDSFTEKIKSAERAIESRKNALSKELQGGKFETARVKISFRKSSVVVADSSADVDKLPESLVSVKVEKKPDKNAIKAYLNAGNTLEGFYVEDRRNISIK